MVAQGCDPSMWDTEARIASVKAVKDEGECSQPPRLPALAIQPVVPWDPQDHPRLCGFLFLSRQALPLPRPG